MNNFKDLGIKAPELGFTGTKIKLDQLKGIEITVHAYKIMDSKFPEKGKDKCLHMQVAIGIIKYVVFTAAFTLTEQIKQVPKDKFPFITTIIQVGERLEFS